MLKRELSFNQFDRILEVLDEIGQEIGKPFDHVLNEFADEVREINTWPDPEPGPLPEGALAA